VRPEKRFGAFQFEGNELSKGGTGREYNKDFKLKYNHPAMFYLEVGGMKSEDCQTTR
jgi:hypothetical protein